MGQLQNQEAQRGDKLGFYGLAERPNAPHRDVRKYSMHTHINMCVYVCVCRQGCVCLKVQIYDLVISESVCEF